MDPTPNIRNHPSELMYPPRRRRQRHRGRIRTRRNEAKKTPSDSAKCAASTTTKSAATSTPPLTPAPSHLPLPQEDRRRQILLRNPSILRADHSHLNRLWCVFCGVDVLELDSSFACGNSIRHPASLNHLRSVEGLLRKHGGGMNRVESFRLSDAELIKWEKGCKSLKNASSTSSEGAIGPLSLPSKDIQHKLSSKNMDSYNNHSITSFNSNAYHAVMPLQSLTNEGYSAYPHKINGDPGTSSIHYMATALSGGLPENTGHREMHTLGSSATTLTGKLPVQLGSNGIISLGMSLTNGMVDGIGSGGDCTKVLQFTQISSAAGGSQANIHTGTLPPWLDASEEKEINRLNTGPYQNKLQFPQLRQGSQGN